MKKEHKIFFRGVPKEIRRMLCRPTPQRATMEHSIPRPKFIRIGNETYPYEGV